MGDLFNANEFQYDSREGNVIPMRVFTCCQGPLCPPHLVSSSLLSDSPARTDGRRLGWPGDVSFKIEILDRVIKS